MRPRRCGFGLNWTNVGLKFEQPLPLDAVQRRLNWTNVGLK